MTSQRRQHIVHSLDTLLYQLHTLSFFLAPSLWSYIFRLVCQSQLSRPKELDSARSLRFLVGLVVVANITSVWYHLTTTFAARAVVVLDFVGMASAPSKVHLLLLDMFILVCQLILAAIAFDSCLIDDQRDHPLLPSVRCTPSTPGYILDLRLKPILAQLYTAHDPSQSRQYLPPSPSRPTSWPMPSGLRNVIRGAHYADDVMNRT